LGDELGSKKQGFKETKVLFALLFLMKMSAIALIEAVSFYGGVHHKRYKRIAGISS
jgi:hypothetical protein